ncbi:Oidioi.mRNA.OKI2018_I69.PAR.g9754.t1.cds [Oikopleura dioica]|uniref:Oidioi.mRNA.OKI2018_I69.PAR.g9754.t1.cds n=1 Tax=Oikopleura dioica TaxID=34765 RepID=A0ABN7RN36_OIKDI|nr:Oidioi.mRNA.OKI2018_I69.PAR.g9754.t1.cds [Oikopleura dioica]
MSYFNDQGSKEDPWASYGNIPSYSFGDQATNAAPDQGAFSFSTQPESFVPTTEPSVPMAGSFATPEAPVYSTLPKAGDFIAQPSAPFTGAPEPPPQQQNVYPNQQDLSLGSSSLSYSTTASLSSYSSDLPSNEIPNYQSDNPYTKKKPTENDSENWKAFRGCCLSITFFVAYITSAVIFGGGPPFGTPENPFVFASSFVDKGSIDDQIVYVCDGHFEYNVSSFGQLQSPNFPGNYIPNAECTNRFTSSSDGITFEFLHFEVEQSYDYVVFQDENDELYPFSDPIERLNWNGIRISFNSSDVEVLFVSDSQLEQPGFNIKIIDGYEESNDIEAKWPQLVANMPYLPCPYIRDPNVACDNGP